MNKVGIQDSHILVDWQKNATVRDILIVLAIVYITQVKDNIHGHRADTYHRCVAGIITTKSLLFSY